MPNLTTPFLHLGGTDINKDMDDVQNWSISLIDELKYILCNLDAGNCQEASKVKAQNIDCSKARIHNAQIQSLTADKLTAGTIDAREIIVKNIDADNINTGMLNSKLVNVGSSDSYGSVALTGDTLIFYEKVKDENGKTVNVPRIMMGRDEAHNYIFTVQSRDAKQGIYMDSDGNIVMTGLFSTGIDGQARTIIDKNGIQSYDANGNRYGLWCNEPNSADMRYADLKLYCDGKEVFKIYNGIDHTSMYLSGKQILLSGNSVTTGQGNWKFKNGASGSFQTADGKTITVSGGLITDIS